ncbi:SDR family NAD(P)-dependent oxidoreductase [Nocardia sp. NBC_01503]|uniref:SDR family NAD(P)-dependent oxidoreductase n=1 Tax=Nocardia sp. NBC_01503 TaxID=2975997 RepID=UPI002E7BF1E2|nr:SDR family NAD(P)-dependent oxidoreductase [Nocardia sp. NBC_01503]WTL30217.1 SDR family NAD(P)-dependent oxidoreductase [Nocardia sp. NBC_01503]
MTSIRKTIADAQVGLVRQVVNVLTVPRRLPRPFGPTLRDRVAGKTVLITGASSGIGRALALRVADAGAIVVVTARRTSELDQLAAEIRTRGGQAFAITSDLSTAEGIDKLADEMLVEFGAPDILVNNAGRSIWRSVAASEHRLHDFERTMRINYFGPVGLMLRLLPEMRRRGSGHVVSSSSLGVITDVPRFSAYLGSKAALEAVMRVAASECLADGVAFTDVRLPLVATDLSSKLGWTGYTALSADAAVDMLVDAIVRRPMHLENLHGALSIWFNRLLPGVALQGLNQLHRMLPDVEVAKAAVPQQESAVVATEIAPVPARD